VTLNFAETSVVKSRPSVTHGANFLFGDSATLFMSSVRDTKWYENGCTYSGLSQQAVTAEEKSYPSTVQYVVRDA